MSTYLDTTNSSEVKTASDSVSSLTALASHLESQKSPPTLEQIFGWLKNAEISAADLAPYRGFKDGNYWRHLVCRNEFVEMLVLCWRPGQRTPIHDHNGSHGGVRVCEGTMWETTFNYDPVNGLEYKSAREYQTGAVTDALEGAVHLRSEVDVGGNGFYCIPDATSGGHAAGP